MAYAEEFEFTGEFRALPERAESPRTAAELQASQDARPSRKTPVRCGEALNATLTQTIGSRLRQSPFLPLREITCEECEGRVVLRGRVPTQYLHELACSLAQSFDGVREVTSKIDVVPLGLPYAPAALREA
jgi:osmotically-inducible protein OsmY